MQAHRNAEAIRNAVVQEHKALARKVIIEAQEEAGTIRLRSKRRRKERRVAALYEAAEAKRRSQSRQREEKRIRAEMEEKKGSVGIVCRTREEEGEISIKLEEGQT